MLICLELPAQTHGLLESVAYLTGAESVEEIDPEEMERFERLCSHPVDINRSSDAKMRETGLFSHYQLVSLQEYRKNHGNVMSLTELSMVDGFNPEFVNMISLFISFGESFGSSYGVDKWMNKLTVRAGLKSSQYLYGLKYVVEKSDRFNCSIAMNHAYTAQPAGPDTFTGNCCISSRGGRFRFLIGDYNARFGQGLAMWNGLNVGGLTSTSGFYRKASGISTSSSFTGSMAHRGIAAEYSSDNWNISLMDAFESDDEPSLCSAANISRFMNIGRVGLTHYTYFQWFATGMRIPDMNTSADVALCLNGIDVFSEVCLDWVNGKAAVLSGIVSPVSDRIKIASMLRYYPAGFSSRYASAHRALTSCTNEYSATLAADFRLGRTVTCSMMGGDSSLNNRIVGHFSADISHFPVLKSGDTGAGIQLKLSTGWTCILSPRLTLVTKLSEKIRTWGQPFKTAFRNELDYVMGDFALGMRTDVTVCDGEGFLVYVEGGYNPDKFCIYFRQGIFFIDDWDARIYVYERDAPGSFSVPAFYGRGVWSSLTGSWKPERWLKLYLRASVTSYPFMTGQKKKPGKAELKLQCMFSF